MGWNVCERCVADCRHQRDPKEIVVRCGAYKAPMTNADRIRAMSDEEMAHTILTVDFCEGCEHCAENGICLFILKHPGEPLYDGCKKALLEWLRKTEEGG